MTDTARLIHSARDGDRGALESLFSRHQGRLLNFIRARMDSWLAQRVSPEDILQETLLESARKMAGFDPQGPSSFYRWLVEIARFKLSEAARAHRAIKRTAENPLTDSVPAAQTSPSGRVARSEKSALLHRALASLPERQAEAVRLRYLEGLTVAETSERLGCSGGAVKALVARGLLELGTKTSPET